MGSKTNKIFLYFLIVFLAIPFFSAAQYWGSKKKYKFSLWDGWAFNANFGKSSFYGDVSIYDDNFSEKLSKESDWAYGIAVRKEINPVISIGPQILFAKLKGENARAYFEGEIIEYNFNAAINVVNLLIPSNDARFYLLGVVGAGQFLFSSKKVVLDPGVEEEVKEDTGVPEFVYMFGAEGAFRLTENIDLMAGIVLRQARNDKIDVTTNKDDWDYYSYLMGGITYNLKTKATTTRNFKKIRGRYPMKRRS
ncbi:MAG: hypothetical protein JXA03_10180 [Bacteroidales bacterium]|nr:hypothetical protein [Bacteroidales bacterium]